MVGFREKVRTRIGFRCYITFRFRGGYVACIMQLLRYYSQCTNAICIESMQLPIATP